MGKDLGITVKKEDNFNEWYTQVIRKGDLIEYTDVSGCLIFKPYSYSIWESISCFIDSLIKERGVQNAYFPLFIPEKNLCRESEHVEGFTPEVAWVTHAGATKLNEKLAVRPTSETIMYPAFSKWIRSHRDLPLKINQWCNVVRWEFKNPLPFLRTREFLWQEGHTAFASKEESDKEVRDILENVYAYTLKELLAVPALLGIKSTKEKFAGALYTTSGEVILPNGKAIQAFTSHSLGQNFAKAFEITFLDKDKNKQYVWQNSWGFTTRTIGIMTMIHSDNKGLVIPPRVAPIQVVIVPIMTKENKEKVLEEARKLYTGIKDKYRVRLDDREGYTSGWKFNEWELKGVPIRLEIGPRDIEKNSVVVARRDNGEKIPVAIKDLDNFIGETLENIHDSLYQKALKIQQESIFETEDMEAMISLIDAKKIVKAPFCDEVECEDWIKEKTGGAKSLNAPFEQDIKDKKCIQCGKPAKAYFYFGKSY